MMPKEILFGEYINIVVLPIQEKLTFGNQLVDRQVIHSTAATNTCWESAMNYYPANRKRIPLEKRFWDKVDKSDINGCWMWTGSKNGTNKAYGHGWMNGKQISSHRASWIITYGEIPEGLHVLHNCDRGLCVNPSHRFLGTCLDNMKDMVVKKRSAVGERNGMNKLTYDQVNEIIERFDRGELQTELAVEFDVNPCYISLIVRGKTRKDVDHDKIVRKHAIQKGEKNNSAKLTWEQVNEIRKRYADGETQVNLSKIFNISKEHISGIVNYKFWKGL